MKKTNIDLLRVIAAFMVLSVHISRKCGYPFDVGAKGVPLFFILSGYLAACHLEKDTRVLPYYVNRCKAILPAYYSCIAIRYLYDLVRSIISTGGVKTVFSLSGTNGIKWIRYILMVQCLIPSLDWDKWNNRNALWSISSFALFYLLAPFIYRLMRNIYSGVAITVSMLIITPYMKTAIISLLAGWPESADIESFAKYAAFTNIYAFLLGVLLFVVIKEQKEHYLLFAASMFLVLSDFSIYSFELIFTMLLCFIIKSPDLIKNDKLRQGFDVFRNAMFSLYLFHPMVLDSFPYYLDKETQAYKKIGYSLILYMLSIGISVIIHFGLVNKIQTKIKSRIK